MTEVTLTFKYNDKNVLEVETVCENANDFALMYRAMHRVHKELTRLIAEQRACPQHPETQLQVTEAGKAYLAEHKA